MASAGAMCASCGVVEAGGEAALEAGLQRVQLLARRACSKPSVMRAKRTSSARSRVPATTSVPLAVTPG